MVSSWENPTYATSDSICLSSKTSPTDLSMVWKKITFISHLIKHFRESFPTDSCLAKLTDFFLTVMNKRMHTSMIYTDSRRRLTHRTKNLVLEKTTCVLISKHHWLNSLNLIYWIKVSAFPWVIFSQKLDF